MKLIVYIPAFNEEDNIQEVISGIPKEFDNIDYVQCLVIDDGSNDKTAMLAKSSGAYVVSHRQNRGVGAAFHSAVRFALENDADILVGIDADNQFDSLEIPKLISPILIGEADMVIGNRFSQGIPANMSSIKYWGNKQVSKLIGYLSDQKFQDVSCGFRAYSREALLHLNLFGLYTYTHETILTLTYQGLKVIECPITVKYHLDRRSRVASSIFLYAIQTSKIIFRAFMDYRPMRLFGTFGILLMLIGSGFVMFLLGHYILNQSFTPYKSYGFIGLSFFILGLIVFLIALITDMINRVRVNQDRLLYELKRFRYDK